MSKTGDFRIKKIENVEKELGVYSLLDLHAVLSDFIGDRDLWKKGPKEIAKKFKEESIRFMLSEYNKRIKKDTPPRATPWKGDNKITGSSRTYFDFDDFEWKVCKNIRRRKHTFRAIPCHHKRCEGISCSYYGFHFKVCEDLRRRTSRKFRARLKKLKGS